MYDNVCGYVATYSSYAYLPLTRLDSNDPAFFTFSFSDC